MRFTGIYKAVDISAYVDLRVKDHLYLKITYELQSIFPFSVIYCVYFLVLINKLNNCKILVAHMDVIIMSLIYFHKYTQ